MTMILGDLAKNIFDRKYEEEGIVYTLDLKSKNIFFTKFKDENEMGSAKVIGKLSIDATNNQVTFHKEERRNGVMRNPQPSWGVHKHLVECGIIDIFEYRVDHIIFKINTGLVRFSSVLEASYKGEPKFYVPLQAWDRIDTSAKPTKDSLTLILEKRVDPSWIPIFREEYEKEYFTKMMKFIKSERLKGISILPSQDNVFYAFKVTGLDKVKVVILGQD